MKNHNKLTRFFILFGIISIFNSTQRAFGQNKLNLVAGVGFPELLNAGLNIQNNQTKFGIIFGSMPLSDEDIISISGNFYYHFGKLSSLSARRFWFVRFGLNYVYDKNKYSIDTYLYLNSRIGRDFNISEKIGIEIGAGVIIQLYHIHNRKKPSDFLDLDIAPPVVPSIGIALFYRI